MSIQEELHNARNSKTLNDYKELFDKINSIVKEELDTDVVTFLQSMHNLRKTVHSRTITEWSYRSK
jgi:hypothetical protein